MAEIAAVQNPVIEFARRKGWLVRRMQFIGRRGCPDAWFFKAGRLLIVEFKDEGKRPDLHQQRRIEEFREAGMTVHVIDSYEAGIELFK
jgi:hypothetical protein